MRILSAAIITALAMSLAGCAQAIINKRASENAQFRAAIQSETARVRSECEADMATSALDPIRSKVELLRTSPTAPAPVALLVDTSTPSEPEKTALLAWSKARDVCEGRIKEALLGLPFPPSMSIQIIDRFKSGIGEYQDNIAQAINYLIAGLYGEQLTYGQFNAQRVEAGKREYAALKGWIAVLDAQDQQQVLAQAEAAQQQLNAFVRIAAALGCAKAKGERAEALCQ